MESDKTYARQPVESLSQEDILRDTEQLLKEFAEDYRRMAE